MKSRILYLVGGVLFLTVSLIGGSWWEILGGEDSNPVLYFGVSPFQVEAKLLGSEVFEPSPFMEALLLSGRLLAVAWSLMVIIGALAYDRPWSRKLVNISPFTASMGFVILLVIGLVALPGLIPAVNQAFPNLAEALIPYSGKCLTVDLYPLMHIQGSVNVTISSRLTPQFWTAFISGFSCLAGAIIRRREIRRGKSIHRQGIFES